MKEVKVNVFTINELPAEAKDRALADWNRHAEYPWATEARKTIEAMEKCFSISCGRWSYDACRSDYAVTHNLDFEVLTLKGDRARSWFWNNIAPKIFRPKNIYRGPLCTSSSCRKSNLSVVCECPWTGMCFDMDALDPLLKFILCENLDQEATVQSIIEDCVRSLFAVLVEDVGYQSSMEAFVESCEANGYTFLENGEMVNW